MKMWPMLVDYSVEDCKKELRGCELVAYSAIISAFRAQGSLTKEKRKLLQDLSSILGISMERHRAEIRRAINDEHLNTIAEKLSGSNTTSEWAIEGRRVVPLMQRHAPQTVFTEIANSVASAQAAKNATLLHPGKTGIREVTNGIEVLASRKRKDHPSDFGSASPTKITAVEGQYFRHLQYGESLAIPEPSPVPESYDNASVPEAVPPISLPEFPAPKNATSLTSSASLPLPAKSLTKKPKKLFKSECESLQHPMLKTPTVTTFSSFESMTSNLITSKAQNSSIICQGDHVSTFSEHVKPPPDQKSTRPVGSMKSSTVVIPTSLSCTTTPSNRGHLSTASSSSQHNKFMSPIRSKSPNYTRPNLPAGLGIKLNPQTQVTQRATVPQKSLGMKIKSESPSFFTKKPIPSTFGSDNQTTQFQLPSSTDALTITKTPVPISKTTPKSEPQTILQPSSSTKATTQASKTIAKNTSAQNSSQYISRSLFSTANKGGATKTLAPVIFNVASTSSPTLQTQTKTGPIQCEVGKTSPQLLPKTTGVGISPSHVKINTSTTQTIQYRNDGGLVRSARILNISQPVGSRLPCAISPSAISALGLTTNISSTALRVTLPAGTLNTTSSIRVSAAAKPNVIVVHKAQMWPRNQQPGAVLMGSSPLSKLPNDIKPDKNRPLMSKAPRAIAPARPLSPAVSYKTSEASMNSGSSAVSCTTLSAASPITSVVPPSEKSTSESHNSKVPDALSDPQCKRNLLADVIEASGILSDKNSSKKPSMKDKNDHRRNSKDLFTNQESEAKYSQGNTASSSTLDSQLNSELTVTKKEEKVAGESKISSGDLTVTLVSQVERNGVDEPSLEPQAPTEVQIKELVDVSSEYFKSSGCSKVQNDVVKEKDS